MREFSTRSTAWRRRGKNCRARDSSKARRKMLHFMAVSPRENFETLAFEVLIVARRVFCTFPRRECLLMARVARVRIILAARELFKFSRRENVSRYPLRWRGKTSRARGSSKIHCESCDVLCRLAARGVHVLAMRERSIIA